LPCVPSGTPLLPSPMLVTAWPSWNIHASGYWITD
jgi:hypothetical protein